MSSDGAGGAKEDVGHGRSATIPIPGPLLWGVNLLGNRPNLSNSGASDKPGAIHKERENEH